MNASPDRRSPELAGGPAPVHGGVAIEAASAPALPPVAEVVDACAAERARARDRDDLRAVGMLAGAAVAAFGCAVGAGALVAHLSAALPLSELAARAVPWCGVVSAVAGTALACGCGVRRRGPRPGSADCPCLRAYGRSAAWPPSTGRASGSPPT